jgi:hypothetical protein
MNTRDSASGPKPTHPGGAADSRTGAHTETRARRPERRQNEREICLR